MKEFDHGYDGMLRNWVLNLSPIGEVTSMCDEVQDPPL